jgi:predicted O-methyltransferase YrrM
MPPGSACQACDEGVVSWPVTTHGSTHHALAHRAAFVRGHEVGHVNDQTRRWRARLAMPVAAGLAVAALVLIARWVSSDMAMVVGPAAATTAVLLVVGRMMDRTGVIARRRDVRARRDLSVQLARLERVLGRQARIMFDQLTALDAVRDILAGAVALPRTRGWAASPDILREIVTTLIRDRPQVVVETGTGASTVAIAACLQRIGTGHLWSLEHLPGHADSIRRQLDSMGLTEYVTVIDAPLVDTDLPGGTWPWYDVAGLHFDAPIDLVFVDGPPSATAALARYPVLPVLRSRLSDHAVIIVDDAARPDERECVRRWQAETPGLTARYLPLEAGASVLVLGGDPAD